MNHRNGNSGSSLRKGRIGEKRKPWHLLPIIQQLHKEMKHHVGNWCDMYFKTVAPESVYPHLLERDELGAQWLKEEGYHWDHKRIRHVSDFSFAMVFEMMKGDLTVNEFEFIVNHDGGFKSPHVIAAMIFVGEIVEGL